MHEAGLAATIARELLEGRRAGRTSEARLIVRGGHDEPEDFDASLRLHLALAVPDLANPLLEIVHVPVDRLCSRCGDCFRATRPRAACPACGSPAMPSAIAQEVELEWVRERAD